MGGGNTGGLNALVDQSILSGGISASMSGNIGAGESIRSPSIVTGKKQGVRTAQAQGEMFEDKFIDNILGTLHDVRQEKGASSNPFQPSVEMHEIVRRPNVSNSSNRRITRKKHRATLPKQV